VHKDKVQGHVIARLQGQVHRVNPGASDLPAERRIAPFEGAAAATRGGSMATFITLARYTQQGISKIKDSPSRVDAFGRYDLVLITETPSDDVVARLTLATGALGNVTTETLRAFTEDEFRKIVSSLP